jgi:hypothetical protein
MSLSEADPAVVKHILHEIGQGFLGVSPAAVAVREQIADFLARRRTERSRSVARLESVRACWPD